MNELEKSKFGFYSDHFKAHMAIVAEIHKNRFRVALLSVAGTLGYYGWIIANHSAKAGFLLWVPVIFNLVGLVYACASVVVIKRHVEFLDHIERSVLGMRNEWTEFRRQSDPTKSYGKPFRLLSLWFWYIMVMCSLVAATTLDGRS